MPTYSFRCEECGTMCELRMTFAEYREVKAGSKIVPCLCETPMTLDFRPGNVQFSLKDGPSGGWISKAGKESKYRQARSEEMARREQDHVFKPKLVPNYGGQETGSWREAQEAARADKGELAAATYVEKVVQE